MIRHAATVLVILCANPSWVAAQGTELSITSASANVHRSPSTGSPVIDRAPRGATLEVTRELGSWVKVTWPGAPDGAGYVHVSRGSLSRVAAPAVAAPAAVPPPAIVEPAPPRPAASSNAAPQIVTRPASVAPAVYVAPTHTFALGARVGGSGFGVGASARAWSRGNVGLQFEASRYDRTNPIDFARMTSTQLSPSALYSLGDHVSDYTWVRPYLGAGATFHRSTWTRPALGTVTSDWSPGVQAFGGSEVTVASLPQLAMSAELGYHWFETPFQGLDPGGLGFSVAGHWYFR
jgi:hypothetical protein